MANIYEVVFAKNLGYTSSELLKRFQVEKYPTEAFFDLRLWKENSPTEEGLTFTIKNWINLIGLIPYINKAIKEVSTNTITRSRGRNPVKISIGGLIYVSIIPHNTLIDFRLYKEAENGEDLLATKLGVILSKNEWEQLCELSKELPVPLPELLEVHPCTCKEHVNVITVCSENYRTKNELARVIQLAKEGFIEKEQSISIRDLKFKLEEVREWLEETEEHFNL